MRALTQRQAKLVEQHIALVEPIARRVGRSLPMSVELDDMVQLGSQGLMAAAQRYKAARGVPFRIYARYRIRGAIIDAYRGRNYHFELHESLPEDRDSEYAPSSISTAGGDSSGVPELDLQPNPEQTTGGHILMAILLRAVATLPEQERKAILRRADGASYREIGEDWGHSPAWAYTVIQSARHQLKRTLAMHRLDERQRAT